MLHSGIQNRGFSSQTVGSFTLSAHGAYLVYYNDGGPPAGLLGDNEDRYWTGGGTIGYSFRRDDAEDKGRMVEFAFDKFTGFTPLAYQATSRLFIDNVVYANLEQVGFNSGRYTLKFVDFDRRFGVSINRWNERFDFQDFLHRDLTHSPYHYKIEEPYWDVEVYGVFHE